MFNLCGRKNPLNKLLFAAFLVPVQDQQGGWQNLTYSKIPGNQVSYSQEGMTIKVDKSSGPLILPLKAPISVEKIQVKGKVTGSIIFGKGKKQGEKGADDFALRVGLVVPGNKTLGWAKRLVAPAWVKKLFSLAPEGSGIDHIYFYNVAQQDSLKGMEREHPLSDLIKEKFQWQLAKPGSFDLSVDLSEPKKAAAIWIAVDGDDTKSSFTTEIHQLSIN